jgi:hypothetical protein
VTTTSDARAETEGYLFNSATSYTTLPVDYGSGAVGGFTFDPGDLGVATADAPVVVPADYTQRPREDRQ